MRILCALMLVPLGWGADRGAVRVCAAQPPSRLIFWKLGAAETLARVDQNLNELEALVHRAGAAGCDALALPEDTLGVLHWEAAHPQELRDLLKTAVPRMLDRLGKAAAAHHMYLVCSSDTAGPGTGYRNSAFLLGRNGRELGRYHKVQPTVTESDRLRGNAFPVFDTPDLGSVGMLICYDMVMPESTRALALGGADVVFVATMGGAVTTGGEDLDRAAFRVRAADNYLYLVVAKRGGGALIVSPQGKVLAEGSGDFVMAEIRPFEGREGGDAMNSQRDMRARLFRERNPGAYGILADPNPPVLKKIPATIGVDEAVRISHGTLTVGEERFGQADNLAKAGKASEAIQAFEDLRRDYPNTWIDRAAGERLGELRK